MEPAKKAEVPIVIRETDEHSCVDCGRSSPVDASEYTLFSSKHGWRITKGTSPAGKAVIEWRCPECFARMRSAG